MAYVDLYADAFDNSSIAADWTQISGTWTENADFIYTLNGKTAHDLRLSTDYDLTEGEMYCDVKLQTEASANSRSGIYFNYKTGETTQAWLIYINATNDKVYLDNWASGAVKNAAVIINIETWYRLGVRWWADTGNIEVYVDGNKLIDHSVGAGYFDEVKKVGLYKLADATANHITYFEDFDLNLYVVDTGGNYVYLF